MRTLDRKSAAGSRGHHHATTRSCDWPGCKGAGEYRAPRSREQLNFFFWFCLDHVRQYNASWNYYEGMSDDEVEADVRKDTTWNRPTWPMGFRLEGILGSDRVRDDFGLFSDEPSEAERKKKALTPWEKALNVLGLSAPVTVAAVKARYKELVKRHHPDANGGSLAAEEKFKQINQAYHVVMGGLAP